ASSIRQQFSSPLNIRLSQHSLAFLRAIGGQLEVGGERPQIGLTEPGYLYLATDAGRATLAANHAVQTAKGAEIALLSREQLRARFPWLVVSDLEAGTLGLNGEGWFDGYSVLQAFRRGATALGVSFVTNEVRELVSRRGSAAAILADSERIE